MMSSVAIHRAPAASVRRAAFHYNALCYSTLLVLVLVYFDEPTKLHGVAFVLLNFVIGAVFFLVDRFGADRLIYYLIYAVYSLVYIIKGIVINVIGLNTAYVYTTIKTHIGPEEYIGALNVVTIGHIFIVGLLYAVSYLPRNERRDLYKKKYLSGGAVNLTLSLLLAWIVATSVIMYSYGVAVMGTEGVSLPYKLSGVFFYTRTLIVPLLLLYILEKSIVRQDRTLFKRTVLIFLVLVVAEVLVRASKGPLFHMTLYLGSLLYLLSFRGIYVGRLISGKHILTLFIAAMLTFPLIEIYRAVVVSTSFDTASYALEYADYLSSSAHQDKNFLVLAIERLFHRLVGFTQMAGFMAYGNLPDDPFKFLEYGSLAQYYTEEILGYHIIGHSSSPSLLGASIMLGGMLMWPVVFSLYIFLMILIWRYSTNLKNLEVAIKCLLAYEIFNTIIAGTIDSSLYRMVIVFSFAMIFELITSASAPQRKALS